jgi:glycosyltransferase involved in cell wall biosynthesis
MKPGRDTILLLSDVFTFGGLENYMLSVRQMCQEEGIGCIIVSLQSCDRDDVVSLSKREFMNVRLPTYAYSLAKLLRKIKPAIVHSQSYYTLVLSSFLKGILDFRTVSTIHNPYSVTEKKGRLRAALPYFLTPDVLIGVSRNSLDDTLKHFRIRARKGMVIYNWVDTQRFCFSEEKDPNKVLFVGRLDSQKKIEMLPSLLRDLRQSMPELTLHVCGDGPLSHIVRGVDGMVCHGRIDEGGLIRLLQTSSLLVLPTRFEGLPLAILESLSCGTPVLASPVGGIPEIGKLSYGCFLAADGDFAQKAEEILLGNVNHRKIHSDAARDFSYKRGKRELMSIYNALLGVQ